MKFLCVDCDEAMRLERTGGPDKGSMTVLFACPTCGRRVAMLTNAMETQMVRSLGVKIGAAGSPSGPMETIHGSLAGVAAHPTPSPDPDGSIEEEGASSGESLAPGNGAGGKCPFTGMVNEAFDADATPEEVVWTADARERLERIPAYVRAMVEKGIVEHARQVGVSEIDGAFMDEARGQFGM